MLKTKFIYGLIGKEIDYSFSRNYFNKKFKNEGLVNNLYKNFDCENLAQAIETLKQKNLKGLNVTIPYKEKIIPYLDNISKEAKDIMAVNTISFNNQGKLIGHNTDCYGFQKSLFENINKKIKNALILGTGGASKAIIHVLKKNSIKYKTVSRKRKKGDFIYVELDRDILNNFELIINTTPLGTYPNTEKCPDINFEHITKNHILFDLIYNPIKTRFLKNGKIKGAKIVNGYDMLIYQAEKSWSIWNEIN
ncbi:MAG: shikimate dehydrogenase family protein [Flavobacteriaceae bacterium]|tara:strand:+ start:31996 stop:32745 length:750 start_codon:yes stop_codon:yes gene_type:complete